MMSIGQMISSLNRLVDTSRFSEWESHFVESVNEQTSGGKHTLFLTDAQVETIEQLFRRHAGH